MNNKHIPVMLNEVIKYLDIKENGIYIDGTFGEGGHSLNILSRLNNKGKLIVIDRDTYAINIAKKIINSNIIVLHSNFSFIKKFLVKNNLLGKVNGLLLDLGVSNNQIKNSSRGFSFMNDGPLDMRMNNTSGITASEWINNASENEIFSVLKKFSDDDKYYKKVSRHIFSSIKNKKIYSTLQLRNLIFNCIKNKHNNFKLIIKYFQAIRIYINNEIQELINLLTDIPDILNKFGKLLVISFHSLEDRIVKNFYKINNVNNCLFKKLPITYYEENKLFYEKKLFCMKEIIKIKTSNEEIDKNYSSRSAILRVFEKI